MTAGERIKERRKELGISAEHVAEKLGVSPATIYRYENGEIEKIPSNVLDGISKVLQTTPAFLMGWDAERREHMQLGQIVKRYREANNMTMQEFADRCELSKGYISMLEQGRHPARNSPIAPSFETIKKLSAGMGMTLDALCAAIESGSEQWEDPVGDAEKEIAEAAASYRRMLQYAITGCKSLLWKTAFDLNRPELGAPMAQEIVFNLQQMAADLAEYEAEAARVEKTGGVK